MSDIVPCDASTPGSLIIRRFDDDRGTVLALAGELDLESAPQLASGLEGLDSARPGRLLIDLSELEFMDSSGLSILVQAHRAARAGGRPIALRPGPPQVQRLFELTGVRQRFTFEE